jgi:hypothetical protein
MTDPYKEDRFVKTSRHKGGRAKTGTLVKTRDGRFQGIVTLKIQQRAGHRDYQTTAGYISTAESVREGFGEVFPVLPDCLVEEQSLHTNRTKSENPEFLRGFQRGGRDSNPPKNSVSAENKLDCGAELLANTAASEAKYPIPGGVIDWRDRSEAAWNTVSRVFGVSP